MQITIREPGSAITHYIAMMLAMVAAVPLMMKATMSNNWKCVIAMTVFIVSMILLYSASATYHAVNVKGRALRCFRKLDHIMIYVLIAGTYTPVCLVVLDSSHGIPLLALVWGTALAGMLVTMFWVNCPKWVSSLVYIAMGWECVCVFRPLIASLPLAAFLWLLIGGILYTVGGVLYAMKISWLNLHKYFGLHEVFHLFIMAGSFCHFMFMFLYVA